MADEKYLTVSLSNKDKERIFSKISINPITGCWEWNGTTTGKSGYGQVTYAGRKEAIHRLIFAYYIKPIPKGRSKDILVVNHICKNRRCCNPAHLELVTDMENNIKSDGRASINRRKTHCINGHPLPPPKIVSTTGKLMRTCKICKQLYDSKRHTRRHNQF